MGCLRAIAALALACALALPWLALPTKSGLRRPIEGLVWSCLLWGFGVKIKIYGKPDAGTRLFCANHVSWLDIAVLGQLVDAPFVAKSEVAEWPIIGPLARRYGCWFIDRQRRTSLAGHQHAIDQHRPVILFPEGTTGPGPQLLPFHSSLFAIAAGLLGEPIQPIAIVYRRRDFTPLDPAQMRKVAWIGDDALLPHAMALAASGGLAVEVHFEPPFTAECRKIAARQCSQAIAARLVSAPQAAATANLEA